MIMLRFGTFISALFRAQSIAFTHTSNPNIAVFPWNPSFGTKYADPPTPIPGHGGDVKFSPNGTDISVTHQNHQPGFPSPLIRYWSVYPWGPGFGTKYADVDPPIPNAARVAFTPDGTDIAVTNVFVGPYLSVYPWGPGFGTRYADPATPVVGDGLGVNFTPDGANIAVAHFSAPATITGPFVSVYPWGPGFGTRYADPATPIPFTGVNVVFTPDGSNVVVQHQDGARASAYEWLPGFGSKYANPTPALSSSTQGLAFSPDGLSIAFTGFSPKSLPVYEWVPGFGTKYADTFQNFPQTTGVAFTADGAQIAASIPTFPKVFVFRWNPGFGSKYANPPQSISIGQGQHVAFSIMQ